jgi:hypothetical protein
MKLEKNHRHHANVKDRCMSDKLSVGGRFPSGMWFWTHLVTIFNFAHTEQKGAHARFLYYFNALNICINIPLKTYNYNTFFSPNRNRVVSVT